MENGHNYSILSQIKFSELPSDNHLVTVLSYGEGDCMHLDDSAFFLNT